MTAKTDYVNPEESIKADEMLKEQTHGDFSGRALITQGIKEAMKAHGKWEQLDVEKKEALESIARKIGSIITGDATFKNQTNIPDNIHPRIPKGSIACNDRTNLSGDRFKSLFFSTSSCSHFP